MYNCNNLTIESVLTTSCKFVLNRILLVPYEFVAQYAQFKASENANMAHYQLQESLELISRKI